MNRRKPFFKLQTTITLLVCTVVALVLLVAHILFLFRTAEQTRNNLEEKAKAVSHTLASTPMIKEALRNPEHPLSIEEYAEEIRIKTGLLFIVVFDMNGIRLTHPDPAMIGKHFVGGDEDAVLHGQETVSRAVGTLGSSLRIFTPVFANDNDQKQLGAVAVGISMNKVEEALAENRRIMYGAVALGGVVGTIGAFLLARKIKKIMFGLEPAEIANLLEERSAMLQSTREGIIAVNRFEQITLINEEAKKMFQQNGIAENPLSHEAGKYWPALQLKAVLDTGVPRPDEEIDFNGSTFLTNSEPVRVHGKVVGAIVTFRDKTEVSQLVQRLSGVSHYAEALRSQTHEFMNQLHVILGMIHMQYYDKLEAYIMGTVDRYHTEIGTLIRQIKDPVIAGFIMGKMNRAREAGIQLTLTAESHLPESGRPEIVHELVTVIGNLLENAMDALDGKERRDIVLSFDYNGGMLTCSVSDNGPGIAGHDIERIFEKGFSTKGTGRGIGLYLVKRIVNKIGGTIVCESKAGIGTKFIVTIPYESKDAAG